MPLLWGRYGEIKIKQVWLYSVFLEKALERSSRTFSQDIPLGLYELWCSAFLS